MILDGDLAIKAAHQAQWIKSQGPNDVDLQPRVATILEYNSACASQT